MLIKVNAKYRKYNKKRVKYNYGDVRFDLNPTDNYRNNGF